MILVLQVNDRMDSGPIRCISPLEQPTSQSGEQFERRERAAHMKRSGGAASQSENL